MACGTMPTWTTYSCYNTSRLTGPNLRFTRCDFSWGNLLDHEWETNHQQGLGNHTNEWTPVGFDPSQCHLIPSSKIELLRGPFMFVLHLKSTKCRLRFCGRVQTLKKVGYVSSSSGCGIEYSHILPMLKTCHLYISPRCQSKNRILWIPTNPWTVCLNKRIKYSATIQNMRTLRAFNA